MVIAGQYKDLGAFLHPPSDGVVPADQSASDPLAVRALTQRMVAGDEQAYRIFYGAYFDRLLRYLLVVTSGNEESAREALQLTLVRVVRHIKVFPREEELWRWLTVLARSAFTDDSRKRRRYFAFLDRFKRHADIHQAADDGLADDQLRGLLERGLMTLPVDERELLENKYLARRSVRDLAGEWHTTEKAIESRLGRIRRKLKDVVMIGLKNEPPA